MLIEAQSVHVWHIPLEQPAPLQLRLASYLSCFELERAQQFKFPNAQIHFQVAHGAMRLILASYLNVSPQEIQLRQPAGDKPELINPATPLFFNLSHSHHLAVCAVSRAAVGIDLEKLRPNLNLKQIAKRFFSFQECQFIQSLSSEAEQNAAFFRLWTAKEAILKGVGSGLAHGLANTIIDLRVGDDPDLLMLHGSVLAARDWRLKKIAIKAGYCCTIAHHSTLDFSTKIFSLSSIL